MQPVHRTLLEVNEEFLVTEAPTKPFMQAMLDKDVLTELDRQQLSRVEAQGPRAVKRFLLHVLPLRGPLAYPALLEALQEAKAQHLVDLLHEGESVLSAAVKPIELPESRESPVPTPDPNEYALKLSANRGLIEQAVDPVHVMTSLAQNGILTPLEEALLDTVKDQPRLAWTVLWGVLLQRGHRAYSTFMSALLQNGYSALFHTIQETKVKGVGAMHSALNRNAANADDTQRAAEDPASNAPDQPPLDCGPEATPRGNKPQQSAVNASIHEAPSGNAPRPHADPPPPGYSQGDLNFMYTPRTGMQMDSGAQGSVQVSERMFYNPAWTDPYNHLRGANVDTRHRMTPSHGPREVVSPGSVSESGDPYDGVDHPDHTRSDSGMDDHEDTRLEAISERDAESETGGSHVGYEDTEDRSEEGRDYEPSPENSSAQRYSYT